MPTYEYVCDACGHKFEEMQSFSADPLKNCPACKQDTLRRLFGTGAALLFKGGGFYETDYRSDSYKQSAKADKPADAAPAASPSAPSAPSTGSSPAKSDGPAK